MNISTQHQAATPSFGEVSALEELFQAAMNVEPRRQRRLRLSVSLWISLMGHAIALVFLAWTASPEFMRWIPVQSGHASIQLNASADSYSFQKEAESELAMQIDTLPELEAAAVVENDPPPIEPMPPMTNPIFPLSFKEPAPKQSPSSPLKDNELEEFPDKRITAEKSEQIAKDSAPSSPSEESQGAESEAPAIVANPAPHYPADALTARQTGLVTVWVKIDPDGRVVRAGIHRSSGVASLDAAALRQIRLWRFAPAKSGTSRLRMAAYPVKFMISES